MKMNTKVSKSNSLAQVGLFPHLLGQRGSVIVFVAVLLPILLAFAGLVIDVGHLFVVRSTLQNASDSASLAAAASLSYGPEEARNQAQLLAQYYAVDGTPVTLDLADIELGNWDEGSKTFSVLSPAQEASANSVRVTAQRTASRNNPIYLFFMRIFGRETSDVRAMAVAYAQEGLCGLIFGDKMVKLSGRARTDSYNSLQGPYISPGGNNGDVCSNGPINLSGSGQVNGDATPGPGESVSISGGAYVTGSTEPMASTMDLPDIDLGDIATNNDNGPIPYNLTLGSNNKVKHHKHKHHKRHYDDDDDDDQLTLTGGRYYFTKLTIIGNGRITVTGKTIIYITDKLTVSGNGIVNVSQEPIDLSVLITSTRPVGFASNADFYGFLYAPDAKILVTAKGDFYGAMIGGEISITGSGEIIYDEALKDVAVLVKMEIPVTTASSTLVQ